MRGIRELLAEGLSHGRVAERFGVSDATIGHIANGVPGRTSGEPPRMNTERNPAPEPTEAARRRPLPNLRPKTPAS